MQPESAALLWDVQNAASHIASFIDGLTAEAYAADDLRRSAVERQLLIIGEALNKLRKVDPNVAEQIPDLSRIIGLRNVLAHGYAVVDDAVVWQAATTRVPELLGSARSLLAAS
ncbi:DUF86 domain-containing protein [Plantibacter sp. Mn2098]|uniref:HepT-like ribonuclease domain-containing protein n=1 Tax=Plantibacter sp. Mn2098 TaxID=3395266 RepID=UPI003BE7A9A8